MTVSVSPWGAEPALPPSKSATVICYNDSNVTESNNANTTQ